MRKQVINDHNIGYIYEIWVYNDVHLKVETKVY